jgi:hypothetical protein
MKKLVLALLILPSLMSFVGCSRGNAPMMPVGMGGYPAGATMPGQDPYGAGFTGADPYAGGTLPPAMGADPYANPADPYANPGMAPDPYANPGMTPDPYANPGTPAVDPTTGQPQPVGINPALDPGVTAQIVSKIQAAGGYRALKADDVVIDYMKTLSMPLEQAFQNSPLAHRGLIIKALLDGWAGAEEVNYASQIWSTLSSQDQQQLMSQDPEVGKLVSKKLKVGSGESSSGGGIMDTIKGGLASLGKLVGIGKEG